MDDRLEKALDFSNHMITLNNQRNLIHEKFLENCVHYVNGGKFNVNRELINFCNTLIQNNQNICQCLKGIGSDFLHEQSGGPDSKN